MQSEIQFVCSSQMAGLPYSMMRVFAGKCLRLMFKLKIKNSDVLTIKAILLYTSQVISSFCCF